MSPKECLKYNFAGLNFAWKCIGFNMKTDGRWLLEIIIDDPSYTEAYCDEIKEVIIEALAGFACHYKNAQAAKILADKITGLVYTVNGECIEPPGE